MIEHPNETHLLSSEAGKNMIDCIIPNYELPIAIWNCDQCHQTSSA